MTISVAADPGGLFGTININGTPRLTVGSDGYVTSSVDIPVGDDSRKFSTTAFVRSAMGSYSSPVAASNGQVLTSAQTGCLVNVSTGVLSVTLPDTTGLRNGDALTFQSTSNADCTISRAGADTIATNNSTTNTITLKAGDSVTFAKVTANLWLALGTATLSGSSSFGKSIGASGYQRLPTGLIIQWGDGIHVGAAATGAYGAVTFPIAFPNSCLSVVTTPLGVDAPGSGYWAASHVYSMTAAGYTGVIYKGTSGGTWDSKFIAIGY